MDLQIDKKHMHLINLKVNKRKSLSCMLFLFANLDPKHSNPQSLFMNSCKQFSHLHQGKLTFNLFCHLSLHVATLMKTKQTL